MKVNNIRLKNWKAYANILTSTLWKFPARKKTGGHSLDYHGGFVPQIIEQVLWRYTRLGDTVLDLMIGSGTTAIEAANMGRKCVGVEIQQDVVESVNYKLKATGISGGVSVIQGNSVDRGIVEKVQSTIGSLGGESGLSQLLVLHPPYDDIIQFSDDPDDLSNAQNTDAFLDDFEAIARNGYDLLEAGRFAVLVIGDKYANKQLVPLGFLCMDRMNWVGFKTKAIIVKDIQGNEKGKGRASNLWRYRALAGGFYTFAHEYVMIFYK